MYTLNWTVSANGNAYNFKTRLRSVALAMARELQNVGHTVTLQYAALV